MKSNKIGVLVGSLILSIPLFCVFTFNIIGVMVSFAWGFLGWLTACSYANEIDSLKYKLRQKRLSNKNELGKRK